METKIQAGAKFKTTDKVLEDLVNARRKEVEELQKLEATQLQEIEKKGQASIKTLRKTLPKDMIAALDEQEKLNKDADAATIEYAEAAKAKFRSTTPFTDSDGGAADRIVTTKSIVGTIRPYYGTLHGSDGKVSWQGYNPGNIDLSDVANGSGSGLFGTGAGSFTVYMDWWFMFNAPTTGTYSYIVNVPLHGFVVLVANDGLLDSKEAHASVNLSVMGFQYNAKPITNFTVFDQDRGNINFNNRIDRTSIVHYTDLLGGGDPAYIKLTAAFYVYARGGGSTAQLNFSSGAANYVGIPSVFVFRLAL